MSRRKFLGKMAWGTVGLPLACAIDAVAIEPHWVDIVQVELPLAHLPDSWVGKKIVQISDLHCSRVVKPSYLRRCVEQVNAQQPDIIVLTGDYITYEGKHGYKHKVIDVLAHLKAKQGSYACLGNHDYGIVTRVHLGRQALRDYWTAGLGHAGIHVLRNQAHALPVDGQPLWIAGLGDLWAGDFRPAQTFDQIPTDQARIALVHNPDAVERLIDYQVGALLCGHTHGGQVHLPLLGPPFLPIRNRQYYAGHFMVGQTPLYVNRGLGRLGRIRFNCRPEITVFTLAQPTAAIEDSAA